jgi:hypothetical protein
MFQGAIGSVGGRGRSLQQGRDMHFIHAFAYDSHSGADVEELAPEAACADADAVAEPGVASL